MARTSTKDLQDTQTGVAATGAQFWRRLLEHVPAVVYLADPGPHRRFRYVSRHIAELVGHTPDDFLDSPALWMSLVHPEDVERVRTEQAEAYENGYELDTEYRVLSADGRELVVWDRAHVPADARHLQGVIFDVTSVRTAEEAVREERDRAQRYLDAAGTVIVVLDIDGDIALMNRTGHELLGYEDGALGGVNFFNTLIRPSDRAQARARFAVMSAGRITPARAGSADAAQEYTLLTREREQRLIAWQHTPLRDEDNQIYAVLFSGIDVTARRAAEKQVAHLALHDPLTSLPNRALLNEHLELAVARARRTEGAVALLDFDLDGFRLVNDSLGHEVGDELLCEVARRLEESARDVDLLAHPGGDGFVLLISDLEEGLDQTIASAADSLLATLARPFVAAGEEFHLSASIGISVLPRDATDVQELLGHAEFARYEAKADGGNRVAVYQAEEREPLRRLSLSRRLRRAIERDELVLHWQPIADPETYELHRLEALMRWEDPERGMVGPGEFIPFAEETGLIEELGWWLVHAIARHRREWAQQGFKVPVSFNVSPRQLLAPDFCTGLVQILGPIALDDAAIVVEITESTAMREPEKTMNVLRELRSYGLKIAIDDFGAGHSSLAQLQLLPTDIIKVDKQFLVGAPEDERAAAMVQGIADLVAALGLQLIVEGVETESQRQMLTAIPGALAQGFLLARPTPTADLEPWLRAGSLKSPTAPGS